MQTIIIDGNSLSFDHLEAAAGGSKLLLPSNVRKQIEASRHVVNQVSQGSAPIYGINTGFGSLANKKIPPSKLKKLQLNLIKSHASGYGAPLSIQETRLAMILRLNVLVKGFTGVRFELCDALFKLIQAEIYPIIPEMGSVGASGDLAPLAHLALPLIGLGDVFYKGSKEPAESALKKAGLEPFILMEKEGLSLINGTQIMLSVGSLALCLGKKILQKADQIAALTFEGLNGSPDSLNPLIHEVRGQKGQILSARAILSELHGSYLFKAKSSRLRLQDPYSLRCAPQVHGASRDSLEHSILIIERELNAVTDNPLVFSSSKAILSGGNFHGQPLALAFDFASMALAELGNISERRLELMLNPQMSGLPAFLVENEGINSGYMAAQYLSASLVNENKLLANPSCTDSIPGNGGIEDFVSMGMTSARKLKRIANNVTTILAIELVAAAQAIDLRKAKPLGSGTSKTYKALRCVVPKLTNDRIIAEDISKAVDVFVNLN